MNKMFHGSHHYSDLCRYEIEDRNREIVRERCCPITVSVEELASAIDETGVSYSGGQRLVERLLQRAHDEAIARTLGILP